MKILTTVTASAGLDVSSTGSDNIKLGTVNTENNDVTVDNLTVWANADFKNNVTLGSSATDNTLVNSKLTASNSLYVSGNLYLNGVDITGSSNSGNGNGLTAQEVSGALVGYAKSTDVSSSFVTNTNATSSLARLNAANIFTTNQTVTGNLLLNGNINIISSSLGTKYSSINNEENLYFGSASANSITTGYRNIALGYRSLSRTNTGYQNISIGGDSLFSNSSGTDNIALGVGCLYKNSSGANNIAIGNASLYSNTAGYNISIGFASLESKVGGSNSVAVGYETLRYATVCSNNTIIGNSSLSSVGLIDSTNNTVIGYNAGNSITSLRNSVIIGANNGSTINGTTGSIIISDGAGNIRIQANSTGLVTIPGALTVTGILTASNTLAVNSGVKFPATQVASADANTLDDYEEGTWTPAYSATTTNFSYNFRTATYTKIGNIVNLYGSILLSSTGSSSGNLRITGLPFTAKNSTGLDNVMSVGSWSGFTGSMTTAPRGALLANASSITLYEDTAGTSTALATTKISNTSYLTFFVSYTVS